MSEDISTLIANYRRLKAESDALELRISELKDQLQPLIIACEDSKWEDEHGYAKIVTRGSSHSFDSKAVNDLAETWAKSTDPITRDHGGLLLRARKDKAGYSYLEIKSKRKA